LPHYARVVVPARATGSAIRLTIGFVILVVAACGLGSSTGVSPRFSAPANFNQPTAEPTTRVPEAGDNGFQGPSTGGSGVLTGTKPESKLWWNDGSWWASMWEVSAEEYRIFRLDLTTQTWIGTSVPLDSRRASRADIEWDAASSQLYVASHSFTGEPRAGFPSYLYRFNYDAAIQSYELDIGFPVPINDYKLETLVIEKDSTGQLWATWVEGGRTWVNATVCSPVCDDATWGAPLALSDSTVLSDDISSAIAFGGDRIGVMWSDQNAETYHFAIHRDSEPDDVWTVETALSGPGMADDHIDLKADSSGRVYAAVKTSLTGAEDPRILLLARSAEGSWTNHVFGLDTQDHTRPILLVDEEHRQLHMFATSPSEGGSIYEKTSSMDDLSFDAGMGSPVLTDADGLLSDATSTKQNVDSSTGLALVAYSTNGYYFHHYRALGDEIGGLEDILVTDIDGP
jgi:hypothetical protein